MNFFKDHETDQIGTNLDLHTSLNHLNFNELGLIPAIAQQHTSGEVLMMAWMNKESLAETLKTGRVCYWSRSRGKLWRKGESSGQEQHLVNMRIDCDGDTLLLEVDQEGAACHTGRRDCFFYRVDPANNQVVVENEPLVDPKDLYR